MASQQPRSGRMRPIRVLPDPDLSPLWLYSRDPLDYGYRGLGGGHASLFNQLMGDMQSHLDEMERMRVVLLDAYPLLALDEEAREARKAARPGGGGGGRRAARAGPNAGDSRSSDAERHHLALDVSGFAPEELAVKLEGRKLTVTGKREERSASGDGCLSSHEYRELRREVLLPEDADLEAVACALAQDGRLCVEAPRRAPAPPEARAVPIAIARSPEAIGQEAAEGAGEE